jgi:hypothetical protein
MDLIVEAFSRMPDKTLVVVGDGKISKRSNKKPGHSCMPLRRISSLSQSKRRLAIHP